MTVDNLRFIVGTEENGDEVLHFLMTYFRVTEPITTSIGATPEDVFDFFCDLRDDGLKNKEHSLLAYEGDTLVGICLNYVKCVDENESLVVPCIDPHKDFAHEIATGPYTSHNANRLVAFVGSIEGNMRALIRSIDTQQRLPTKIFKVEVLCVHPDHNGKGIGRKLLTKSFEHAANIGCDVLASCATAQASQALFAKFDFTVLREMPFSCFREHKVPVFQQLRDKGLSAKLMAKWIQ